MTALWFILLLTAPPVPKPVAYFGVISRYNPVIMYQNYQPIMDYLTAHTGFRFELRLERTYEEMVKALCDGRADVASLGGLTYLEAHHQCDAFPILMPLNKAGKPSYRSVVIVRKDSSIRTPADLKGRTFGFASLHSTSGNLVARWTLFNSGIPLSDLASYKHFSHHEEVAKAVLKGEIDAGAVKDIVAERYLSQGLVILERSDPIPSVPIVATQRTATRIIEDIKATLLGMKPADPAAASWDEEFRYGFIPSADKDFDGLRRMANDIGRTCGAGCHPDIRF